MKTTVAFLITVFAASLRLWAMNPEPYSEAVMFSCRLTPVFSGMACNNQTLSVASETGTATTTTSALGTESTIQTAWLKPGKVYAVSYTGTLTRTPSGAMVEADYDLSFIAPFGYSLIISDASGAQAPDDLIQGNITAFASPYAFTRNYFIELRSVEDDSAAPAGLFSGIDLGESANWQVSLGGLRNGRSAGRISFREKDLTNAPASRDRLSYAEPQSVKNGTPAKQVDVRKDGASNATLRQIMTPQVFVDLVDVSGDGYWIKFYRPNQVTYTGVTSLYTINGGANPEQPWRSIRVRTPATSVLEITETEGAASRVSRATAPSITSDSYTWTLQVGDGTTWLRTTTHVSTKNFTPYYRDVIVTVRTGDAAGTVVAKSKQRFEQPYGAGQGEELTQVITDPDSAALTTSYAYHATPTSPGNFRHLKSITYPTGGWRSFVYYDDYLRRGRVSVEAGPYVDAPATVQPAAFGGSNMDTVSRDYMADYTGRMTLESQTLRKTNVTDTGKQTASVLLNQTLASGLPLYSRYTTNQFSSGTASALTTVQDIIAPNGSAPDTNGLPYCVKNPDESQTTYVYHRGTYSGTTFTTNTTGDYFRTVAFHGSTNATGATQLTTYDSTTVSAIYLLPKRSTMEVTIRDEAGKVLRTESHVCTTGTNFTLLSWQNFTYDFAGRLLTTTASNGTTAENIYTNGLLSSSKDVAGTEITFGYDSLWRVNKQCKVGATLSGFATQAPIYTYLTYDGANRVKETVVSASATKPSIGSVVATDIFTTANYDLAGRITQQVANAGATDVADNKLTYTTGYSYPNPRISKVTLPGGGEQFTEVCLDGQLRQIYGSAVVSVWKGYWVDGGNFVSQTVNGGVGSNALIGVTDWLGRKTDEWFNGGDGTPYHNRHWTYNTKGQLEKFTQPGTAAILYAYNTLGQRTTECLDVNGNSTIDLASLDRITTSDVQFYKDASTNHWWLESKTGAYATDNNSTQTTTGISRQRLTNFGSFVSETQVTDINGNVTTAKTAIDRANKKVTTTTDVPDSTTDAETIAFNGLTVQSKDTSGITAKAEFDSLGRPVKAIDPRTAGGGTNGTITSYYAGSSMPEWVKDPATTIQATYKYDSAGRVQSLKNALNKMTYFSYTNRNQKFREWGEATSPAEYEYDSLSRQTTLKTYATSTASFTGAAWPNNPDGANTTTWNFSPTSGLLTSKVDAAGKSTSFTYWPSGQVKTRTSARNITTNYAYVAATGELSDVTYSDSTPAVVYHYNRLGQTGSVDQVLSPTSTITETYERCLCGKLDKVTLDTAYFGGRVIDYGLSSATPYGRTTGYQFKQSNGTVLQDVSYGYFSDGRLQTITGDGQQFTYAYTANSHLINSLTTSFGSQSFTDTRGYDPNNNWTDSRETKWGSTTYAKFDYTQKVNGQIETVTKTGTLYSIYGNGSEGLKTTLGYNDRLELTSDQTKVGATSTVLTGRNDTYDFDLLGNRKTSSHNGKQTTYAPANSLNQYTSRTLPGYYDLSGSSPAVGPSNYVVADGVQPARSGQYFFQDYKPNANGAALAQNSLIGESNATAKDINGAISFNYGLTVGWPTVTGPSGTSVTALEFPAGSFHVGIDKSGPVNQSHGYNFQNDKQYLFGFWARTLSGTRTITPLMTEHINSTTSGATFTIDTNWKWIVIKKTFSSQTGTTQPRCFYTWDGGGQGAFQVYGAMIVETNEAGGQFSFLPTSPHSFTYDDDGNMTYDGQWGYAYDAENRPYWMETNANAVAAGAPRKGLALTYDHAGRRIRKIGYQWSSSINNWTVVSDTKFVYDGWNLIAELDWNSSTSTWDFNRSYLWGLDLSGSGQGAGGVGGLLMTKGSFKYSERDNAIDTGKTLLAVHDAMGNVHGMVSTSTVNGSGGTTYAVGSLVASYEYDAFGKTLREEGPYAAANPFRYSTKYTDNETGLVYYGMRYYAPSLGRFINRDPIAEQGGLNLYGFVGNDGVNRWDYLGMDPDLVWAAKLGTSTSVLAGASLFWSTDPTLTRGDHNQSGFWESGALEGHSIVTYYSDGTTGIIPRYATASRPGDGIENGTALLLKPFDVDPDDVPLFVGSTIEFPNITEPQNSADTSVNSGTVAPKSEGVDSSTAASGKGDAENLSRADFQKLYGAMLKAGKINVFANVQAAREMTYDQWKAAVRTKGIWDYKNNAALIKAGFTSSQLDAFGNVHFGIVAQAFGFNLAQSMYGAGSYQVTVQGGGNAADLTIATQIMLVSHGGYLLPDSTARSMTRDGFTWGDNTGDSLNIMRGWDYANTRF